MQSRFGTLEVGVSHVGAVEFKFGDEDDNGEAEVDHTDVAMETTASRPAEAVMSSRCSETVPSGKETMEGQKIIEGGEEEATVIENINEDDAETSPGKRRRRGNGSMR